MDLTEKITEIKFKWLKFVVHGDKIDVADGYSGGETPERCNFAEVNVAGDNKPSHMGVKLSPSSEGSVLKITCDENETEKKRTAAKIKMDSIFHK